MKPEEARATQKTYRRAVAPHQREFVQDYAEHHGVPTGLQPTERIDGILEWNWVEHEDLSGHTTPVWLVDGPFAGRYRLIGSDLVEKGALIQFANLSPELIDEGPSLDEFPTYRLERRDDGMWIGRRA